MTNTHIHINIRNLILFTVYFVFPFFKCIWILCSFHLSFGFVLVYFQLILLLSRQKFNWTNNLLHKEKINPRIFYQWKLIWCDQSLISNKKHVKRKTQIPIHKKMEHKKKPNKMFWAWKLKNYGREIVLKWIFIGQMEFFAHKYTNKHTHLRLSYCVTL